MAKTRVHSKKIIEPEETEILALSITHQVQELMGCGFTYNEAIGWLRKKHIEEIFEKNKRIEI